MDISKDFPILQKSPTLVYLDSACTSLKPHSVISALESYYTELGACGGRSSHRLGRETTFRIDDARDRVARFVGATAQELIWTRNTTEGLNLVANSLDYSKRKRVVTSVMEHHSVLLPLMRLREKGVINLEILGCDNEGIVSDESWEKIDKQTAMVVTSSWNNSTGIGHDIRKLAKIAHDNGALICVDGAQGVPHHKTDFKSDGVDILCFSGHKMLGPSGIGAVVARKDVQKIMEPLLSGGGTVKTVGLEKIVPVSDQTRFEAGVQHYSGMLGLAAACDYLKKIGMEKIEQHETALAKALLEQLKSSGAEIYGPKEWSNHGALYTFNFKGAPPHEVALMLDQSDIALRSGYFCTQPAMEAIGARQGAVRASCYIYNSVEDIRRLGEALQKISAIY